MVELPRSCISKTQHVVVVLVNFRQGGEGHVAVSVIQLAADADGTVQVVGWWWWWSCTTLMSKCITEGPVGDETVSSAINISQI